MDGEGVGGVVSMCVVRLRWVSLEVGKLPHGDCDV